jgi:hypothetical protein
MQPLYPSPENEKSDISVTLSSMTRSSRLTFKQKMTINHTKSGILISSKNHRTSG